ncbi:hydrogenase expression/formation protein HypE [Sulfurimonas aquatica]|uniref:Hydrogenase expression/formation protein HypE n=1 Tax=Sulfurimonas aquatica TaxID=2672570 RepID=A0A975B0I9_9BACT|nr:hydrogenase expression/formation protein HypE [Sulfurimonas aquatica]QSZ41969.1 hydrogenase expression/formation protein HypE [Sulfurimonas aquatica]
MKTIQLSHGGGGEETNDLISDLFYKHFSNEILLKAEDAAILHINETIAFTTDSFTVSPIFFKGGDIGKLAIAGTVNDLAMMGAKPLYLSSSFIIEEGFSFKELERIVITMKNELAKSGAKIVCGDTKVVPKGSLDKIFINTAGIGALKTDGISAHNIQEGDAIIVSRDFGRHGATILAAREGIELDSDLESDCETLWPAVEALINSGIKVNALRDATRGGLAAVLNEWALSSNVCIEVEEEKLPVCDEVQGICEMLGFEAYDFANEGTFILSVSKDDVEKVLDVLKEFDFSSNATYIGSVTNEKPKKVILHSAWGSRRYLELPKGELLPRIC